MSKKRQAERKAVRCQAIVNTATATHQQCTDRATGYIRLPAKFFVCAEHRKVWRLGGYMRFADRTEAYR